MVWLEWLIYFLDYVVKMRPVFCILVDLNTRRRAFHDLSLVDALWTALLLLFFLDTLNLSINLNLMIFTPINNNLFLIPGVDVILFIKTDLFLTILNIKLWPLVINRAIVERDRADIIILLFISQKCSECGDFHVLMVHLVT